MFNRHLAGRCLREKAPQGEKVKPMCDELQLTDSTFLRGKSGKITAQETQKGLTGQ